MKDWIIRLLGGFTNYDKLELINKQNNAILSIKKSTFRKGDVVYWVSKSNENIFDEYYLLESYNCSRHWYVSKDPNDKTRSYIDMGKHINELTHEKPQTCICCGREELK